MYQLEIKKHCKENKIVITNDKGCLSKEDIDRMVSEAEKYKEEDDNRRKVIDAKNGFEGYIYSVKNSLDGERVKSVFSEEELKELRSRLETEVEWVETHDSESLETYERHKSDLESYVNPFMSSYIMLVLKPMLEPMLGQNFRRLNLTKNLVELMRLVLKLRKLIKYDLKKIMI